MYVFNKHIRAISRFKDTYDSISSFNGKLIGIKDGDIVEIDSSDNIEYDNLIETGLVDFGVKSYTTDAFLERLPVNSTDMSVISKEGVQVDYTFDSNVERINLAKGHKSKYFKFSLKTESEIIKELWVVVEQLERL